MTNAEIEQLNQLQAAGFRGVWAGYLINKPATRELVRDGYADNGINGGGSPSALGRVFITDKGRSALHPTHIDALEKRVKELEAERSEARQTITHVANELENHYGRMAANTYPGPPKELIIRLRSLLNGGAKP